MAAADETTEKFAEVMNEALADAARAEAERDVLVARVAELEAKYEPPRPVGNTPIRIVSGRAYLVKVYTTNGNYSQKDIVWRPRVAGATYSIGYGPMLPGDFGAAMYQSCPCDDDIGFSDVVRVDMIEFEGDAPHESEYGPIDYESRGFIEEIARENLPNHVTETFVDDEPGAPYPTQ